MKSNANVSILKTFAKKQFLTEYYKFQKEIARLLDIYLEDCIDIVMDDYKTWDITASNVADCNVQIWKCLRERVITSMRGYNESPEDRIEEMFQGPRMPVMESKHDGFIEERDMELLHDQYVKSWGYKDESKDH